MPRIAGPADAAADPAAASTAARDRAAADPTATDPAAHVSDGARAAVLARLWGGLAREPIPGLGRRRVDGDTLTIALSTGGRLTGLAGSARPFEPGPPTLAVLLDGVAHTDPAALIRALPIPGATARLAVELENSVANLALARSAQPGPDGRAPFLARAAAHADPLAYLEQSVVDGHPLHPCCRTRIGLSAAEVRRYAPEHRPLVELVVVAVPDRRWHGTRCPPRLLLHPWQRDHVLDAYPWLRPEPATVVARPLMSLRTLALADDPGRHVKLAVDVQMTSAVRIVSPAAIHNGPVLSDLLPRLAPPGLELLTEPAAGAAIVDGEPSRRLAMLWRTGPALRRGELALPLAALAAPSPANGRPLLVDLVRAYADDPLAFVADLARLLVGPLLTLLGRGVALEAHGQNLLLVLAGRQAGPRDPADGRLGRLLYRDLGGVRISPARLRRHGVDPPRLLGDLVSDDPDVLRAKVFGSAFATVLAEVAVIVRREYGVSDGTTWAVVAAAVRAHRDRHGDRDGDIAALLGPTLPMKALTAMRLADEPLTDLWAAVANPMEGAQ
jgi:staphyloferrin A synthase